MNDEEFDDNDNDDEGDDDYNPRSSEDNTDDSDNSDRQVRGVALRNRRFKLICVYIRHRLNRTVMKLRPPPAWQAFLLQCDVNMHAPYGARARLYPVLTPRSLFRMYPPLLQRLVRMRVLPSRLHRYVRCCNGSLLRCM
jgi:hypothetical protein